MIVEFFGIAFFSFLVGSINNLFVKGDETNDIVNQTLEDVDIWLVKLDSARKNKSLPERLYQEIRIYIRESVVHEHRKLIKDTNYLEQLKPHLRYLLVKDLFPKFFKEFTGFFKYKNHECGKEFVSHFVSQLYCRIYIAN